MTDLTKTLVSRDDLYTARWYALEVEKKSTEPKVDELARDLHQHLSKLLGEVEPDRPDPVTTPGEPPTTGAVAELEHPLLTFPSLQMNTVGVPAKGVLDGLVVHHTAGRYEKGLETGKNTVAWGQKSGYAFWVIPTTGDIIKTHELDQWGNHCGVSRWPGVGSYVSDRFLGVEICNAGRLSKVGDKFMPWYSYEDGKLVRPELAIPADQVRHIEKARYPGEVPGYYHKFTAQQEAALVDLILYLKSLHPNVFQIANVAGHDELRMHAGKPGDKQDPGGSLSMGMPELRALCVKKWEEGKK